MGVYTEAMERFARKSFNSGGNDEMAYGGERGRKGLVVDCRRDIFNIQRACVRRGNGS